MSEGTNICGDSLATWGTLVDLKGVDKMLYLFYTYKTIPALMNQNYPGPSEAEVPSTSADMLAP